MFRGTKLPFSSWLLPTLVITPMVGMVLLTLGVLLPTLNNPESRIYSSDMGAPARQRQAGKLITVETFVVQKNTEVSTVGAPGVSVALDDVNVRPEMNGVVEQVLVKEGDWVKKGQPLFRLSPDDVLSRVQQARTDLVRSQTQLHQRRLEFDTMTQLLEEDVALANARLGAAEDRVQDNEVYIQQQREQNGNAARIRLDNAHERLKSMRYLHGQGAISEFRLLDAEDLYAERLQDFESATQGEFFDQNARSINQDFLLERTLAFSTAQKQLANHRKIQTLELESLRLTMEKAQAKLEEAETLLDKTQLYAVTDGLISNVNVDAGDFYEIGEEALLTLSQDVVFEAFVDQVRLDAIGVGDVATVRLVAYPGQTFTGTVIRVNPAVETEGFRLGKVSINRQYTYSVWVKVEALRLSPGLQGFVTFKPDQEMIRIPERAVTHLSGGEGMVMVVEQGRAVVRQVGMGPRFDNTREIISGLAMGEQVILDPRVLQPGDRVMVNPVDMDVYGEVNGGDSPPQDLP